MLGAGGDRASEVGGAVHENVVAFKPHIRILPRQLQDHPGKFSVGQKNVAAAAEEAVRHSCLFQQPNQLRQGFVFFDHQEVRRAANLERSFRRERHAGPVFNSQGFDGRNQFRIVNPHFSPEFSAARL